MRRRDFCRATMAAGVVSVLPGRNVLAAVKQNLTQVITDLPAINTSGGEIVLESAAIEELKGSLRGELLMPGNAGYDTARSIWNAMIDRRPTLIARCQGAADVSSAITFAKERDLLVSVRGGGHSISGKSVCEGGLMIDMSDMNSVRVDRDNRTARADGGCLEGHIDHETAYHGLATTGGIVSHTGAGGLTLGGGFGRICRQFSMACDNLVSADIVTPDGKFLRASSDENPDLLWALKGGGGNFGVVTALEYRLHPMNPIVLAGDLIYSWADARDVLNYYGEHGNAMPDELNVNVTVNTNAEGNRVVVAEAVWCGDLDKGDAALAGLRKISKPIADTIAPVKYTTFQKRGDNSNHHGIRGYMKSSFVNEFTPALTDEIIDLYRPDPIAAIFFMQAGGAVARVAPEDTAFPHRSAHSNMMCWKFWSETETLDQRQERISSVREDWARLEPYTHGFYVNLNDDSEKKTYANYGVNYPRLVEVKNRYDPTNLLRLNANIQPTV
jgi:FAD/FMN-containing dehydrogenase